MGTTCIWEVEGRMWKDSAVQSPKCTYLTIVLPLTFLPLTGLGPPDDNVRKAFQMILASYDNSSQFSFLKNVCTSIIISFKSTSSLCILCCQQRYTMQTEWNPVPIFWEGLSQNCRPLSKIQKRRVQLVNHCQRSCLPCTRETAEWHRPILAQAVYTGQVGRPEKLINDDWLWQCVKTNCTLLQTEFVKVLGINQNMLYKKLKKIGLHKHCSEITDKDLEWGIQLYKTLQPESGLHYIMGFLHCHSLKIQQDWVWDSMEHINCLGNMLWHHGTILQHKCMSHYSDAVVHLDENHKLIKWRFVNQNMVDGHDHMVSLCDFHLFMF